MADAYFLQLEKGTQNRVVFQNGGNNMITRFAHTLDGNVQGFGGVAGENNSVWVSGWMIKKNGQSLAEVIEASTGFQAEVEAGATGIDSFLGKMFSHGGGHKRGFWE